MTDQIAHFIEGIRVCNDDVQPSTSARKQGEQYEEELDEAKQKTDHVILAAEHFKATINKPTGKDQVENFNKSQEQYACSLDMDDQFFHITCHIEEGIKSKIQKGQYVELEKLLPKTRNGKLFNENKMELVYKDSHSYFIQAQSDNKINGIQKWEQAFRVYVTIYSQANPARAAEIWQYVHVMNTAAASYSWENVSSYDVTFRHLMHEYLQRSWAKIYQQMWCMSMKDPVQCNQLGQQAKNSSHNSGNSGPNGQHGQQGKTKKKPIFCWAWNKGGCERKKCHFVDRCSYCDAGDHGLNRCPKKKEDDK